MRALLLLALTGCLSAPSRPSEDPDGGVDAEPTPACEPTPEAVLDVVGIVPDPQPATGDMLVRAGRDRGTAYVFLYEAGLNPLRRCATAALDLGAVGPPVTKVLAFTPGTAGKLLVLAAMAEASSVSIYEIDLASRVVAPDRIEAAYTPGPAPFIAFLGGSADAQIWFGGPDLLTVDVLSGFDQPGPVVQPILSPSPNDKLLLAAGSVLASTRPFDLVGQVATHRAGFEDSGTVPIIISNPRNSANCNSPDLCPPQLARPIFSSEARQQGYAYVVVRPDTGQVALHPASESAATLRTTVAGVLDITLDNFDAGTVDAVVLAAAAPRQIFVYTDIKDTPERAPIAAPITDHVTHVVTGNVTRTQGRVVLGLSSQPAAPGASEVCYALMGPALVTCPP